MRYLACAIHPSGEVVSSGEVYDSDAEAYSAACDYTDDLNDVLIGMGEDDSLVPHVAEIPTLQ